MEQPNLQCAYCGLEQTEWAAKVSEQEKEIERLNVELSNYAYHIDRTKAERDKAEHRGREQEKEIAAWKKTIDGQRIMLSRLYELAEIANNIFQMDQTTFDFKFTKVPEQAYEELLSKFILEFESINQNKQVANSDMLRDIVKSGAGYSPNREQCQRCEELADLLKTASDYIYEPTLQNAIIEALNKKESWKSEK